jgi:hypothetical protein
MFFLFILKVSGDPDPHSHQNVTVPNTALVIPVIVLSGF